MIESKMTKLDRLLYGVTYTEEGLKGLKKK